MYLYVDRVYLSPLPHIKYSSLSIETENLCFSDSVCEPLLYFINTLKLFSLI